MKNQTKSLTIITITKDDEQGFKKTISSLKSQLKEKIYLNKIYLIVIQKKSSYVYKVLRSIEKLNLEIKVINQENSGIYSAFNIGLKNTLSDWLIFINSGDQITNLQSILKAINIYDSNKQSMLCFKSQIISKEEKLLYTQPIYFGDNRRKYLIFRKLFPYLFNTCHQGIVFSTQFHQRHFYKTNNVGSDALVIKKLLKKAVFIESVISKFNTGGLSSNAPKSFRKMIKLSIERYKNRHFYQIISLFIKWFLGKINLNVAIDKIRSFRYKLLIKILNKFR